MTEVQEVDLSQPISREEDAFSNFSKYNGEGKVNVSEKVKELSKEIEKLRDRVKVVPELETKLMVLEQSEQNLKRQRQNLQIEISELKIQIEKNKMGDEKEDTSNKDKKNETLNHLTLIEAKDIINELLEEVEEIKKEKNEISEKALNLLTEKELANMELREQLEELKQSQYIEINNLAREIYFKENESTDKPFVAKDSFSTICTTCSISPHTRSNSVLPSISFNIGSLDYNEEFNLLKEKLKTVESQKDNLLKDFELEKLHMKTLISSLEEHNQKLKEEITTGEEYRNIEYYLKNENLNKNVIFSQFESLQNTIKYLEDRNQESEQNLKCMINKLKEEINEMNSNNKKLKTLNEKLEKENAALKNDLHNKLRILSEKNKNEIGLKEKEIKFLKMKNEDWTKEKTHMTNEFENFKKNNEINKENYQKLQDHLQMIKENYEKEKKVYEDKLIANEKRLESEKNKLIEQLSVLQTKFNHFVNSSPNRRMSTDILKKKMSASPIQFTTEESTSDLNIQNILNTSYNSDSYQNCINAYSTLSDCLDEALNIDESPEAVIVELENRIEVYGSQVSELNLKLNLYTKKEKEFDFLKIENTNMKENLERFKNIYEEQIKELQKKNLIMNAELLSLRKNMPLNENAKAILDNNHIEIINDNLIKINTLTIEVENVKSLLGKEREAFENEINKNEDKLCIAKLQLAQLSFEKESNEVRLKKENKKFRMLLEKLKIRK